MAQSHSVTGMHYVDTVFTNWFYPQNSELLHAVGMLLTGRDTLSLFLNFGWLAVAFLAAWCIGRPYGRGPLSVVAAAILLECHTLVVREPGAAKNDLMAAALLLAAIAILVNAWSQRADAGGVAGRRRRSRTSERPADEGAARLPVGWPLAAAGLAVGLAAGTKVDGAGDGGGAERGGAGAGAGGAAVGRGGVVVRAGAAGRRLLVPAQPGRRRQPAARRSRASGRSRCRIPERLQDRPARLQHRPLRDRHRRLAPLLRPGPARRLRGALAAGHRRRHRWRRSLALSGAATASSAGSAASPCSACSPTSSPRSAPPAPRAPRRLRDQHPLRHPGACSPALVLVPLPRFFDDPRRQWGLLGGAARSSSSLTDRADAVLRDPDRLFALLLVVARRADPGGAAAAPAAAAPAAASSSAASPPWRWPWSRSATRSSATTCDERFRNEVADESIPGMHLDSAYRWARGIEDARIGLAGTTAGFAQYGFYGTDLSNRVVYLGDRGPARRLQRDPDLRAPSAPPSTPPTSTTWSPRPSSTSSTPATRSPRPRRAGCAASRRWPRSSAAARSPSGRSAAASTRPPAAPPTPRCAKSRTTRRRLTGDPSPG